ncbi:MAG: TIM barrel protein [Planctomycetia bacterium]|nr:TIM barrel protein [Planctomycetia bacterium]
MNRREFIQTGLSAAAVGAAGTVSYAASSKKLPFALQINSVAGFARKDFNGTMKRIADLGFQAVEFAGYYGKSPDFLRKGIEDAGMQTVGTHLGIQDLLGKKYKETVEFNKILGNAFLVIGHGLDQANKIDIANQMTAWLVNELATKAKCDGMFVAYHPHAVDFAIVNKTTAWDLFFSRTSDDVLMQMDVANSIEGKADPIASMKKFPAKNRIVHLKASGPDGSTVCGPLDQVDWKALFDFTENTVKSEWYILEQYPKKGEDAFAAVQESVNQFKKMGKMA